MIPSQNAIRYCSMLLRAAQHQMISDSITMEVCCKRDAAMSHRIHANDIHQVAQFLEERIIETKLKKGKK